MINVLDSSGQKRILDAYCTDVQTANKELIQFSEQLSNLPPGDPENLLRGVEFFLKLPQNIQDTALLILLYHQRAYFYFDGENEYEYSFFFDDSGSPIQDRIEMFCTKYKQFGFELSVISDGDIVTKPISGFLKESIKDSISEELRSFLDCYSQSEVLSDLFFFNNYEDYQSELGLYLIFLEKNIAKYNFVHEFLKTEYVNSIISFLFRDEDLSEMSGYDGFHIKDAEYERIFTDFIQNYPDSRTTVIIYNMLESVKNLNNEQVLLLYNLLHHENKYDKENMDCEISDFNYDNLVNVIDQMIQCIKNQ